MTLPSYTTISAWPLAIAKALQQRGIEPTALLQQAGIDYQALQQDPDGRVDIRCMTRLWHLSEQQTGDSAFGLSVAACAMPTHFRALGLVVMTCDDMLQALQKLAEYYTLVSNTVRVRLLYEPDRIGFCVEPLAEVEVSPLAIEAFFAVIYHLANQLTDSESRQLIVAAELMRSVPVNTQPWQQIFSADIRFASTRHCLWFSRQQLGLAKVMGNRELRQVNESVVKQYLAELQLDSWRSRVEQHLLANLEQGEPTLTEVARQFEVSERSLRRYLSEEQTSFRECLQQVRQQLAQRLLTQALPVNEVAYRIGFSDSSNFSRAFQRWTGLTPAQYRQKHHHSA